MKNVQLFLMLVVLIACKQPKKEVVNGKQDMMDHEKVVEKTYPEALQKVFEVHGGLDLWKQQRSMAYQIPKPEEPEIHYIDLWSRKDRIDIGALSMGFDGKTWILDTEGTYKGNPEFYHNLLFYFYAMPFVLADEGIIYTATEDLEFEGKRYPGIQISYDPGIGASPKDEYYLHYDPETYKMEWLGYTVTYSTGEESDNVKWIRYNDWGNFNGLVLPNTISWYNYEGRDIKDLRNTLPFENITLSTEAKPEGFYAKPDGAEYYVRKEP